MRLAVYELLYTDIPPKVAMNEAVEIAKEFADEGEASFVNGIINRIAKENSSGETVAGEACISSESVGDETDIFSDSVADVE